MKADKRDELDERRRKAMFAKAFHRNVAPVEYDFDGEKMLVESILDGATLRAANVMPRVVEYGPSTTPAAESRLQSKRPNAVTRILWPVKKVQQDVKRRIPAPALAAVEAPPLRKSAKPCGPTPEFIRVLRESFAHLEELGYGVLRQMVIDAGIDWLEESGHLRECERYGSDGFYFVRPKWVIGKAA